MSVKIIIGLRPALLVLCSLVALLFSGEAPAAPPSRILFIGNSYTYVNKLPEIVEQIVSSVGHPKPTIKTSTPGGCTLLKHSTLPATLKNIDEGNWDVVVIQGQSQEAAMAEKFENMRDNLLNGSAALCKRIKEKSPHVRVVFYETWARHANYWQDPKADKAEGDNPVEMQARIRKWYLQVSEAAIKDKVNAVVAPVGDAWELNYKSAKPLGLHSKDNSHPAFPGSYLAALVIYNTIYHPQSLAVPYHGNLSEAEAKLLQGFAWQSARKKEK